MKIDERTKLIDLTPEERNEVIFQLVIDFAPMISSTVKSLSDEDFAEWYKALSSIDWTVDVSDSARRKKICAIAKEMLDEYKSRYTSININDK